MVEALIAFLKANNQKLHVVVFVCLLVMSLKGNSMLNKKWFGITKNEVSGKRLTLALASVLLVATSSDALAAGGLDKVTKELEDLRFWLYTVTGVVSIGHLIWCYLQVKVFEKKTWGDVLQAMVTTAFGGAMIAIGTYLWGLFS